MKRTSWFAELLFYVLVLSAILLIGWNMAAHGQCVGGSCPVSGGWRPAGIDAHAWIGGGRGAGAQVIGPMGGQVSAGVTPPFRGEAWPAAMVRLESPRARWSGVVIAASNGRGIVATSSHSFPDSEAAETVAVFRDGTRIPCSLAGRDDTADCVLLWITSKPRLAWKMAERNPRRGERIVVYGFGGTGQPCRAVVTGAAAPGGTDRWEWFSFAPDSAAQPGDSGGPIMGSGGRLVGIVSGTGTGVGVSVIRALLVRATETDEGPVPPDGGPPPAPDTGRLDDLEGRVGVLEARPVVPVHDWELRFAEIQARDEATLSSLEQHSEAIRANAEGIAALNGWKRGVEDRLAALEGRPASLRFIDRYMTPDPNGDHEHKGVRYRLVDERIEDIPLGGGRITYYYPIKGHTGGAGTTTPGVPVATPADH